VEQPKNASRSTHNIKRPAQKKAVFLHIGNKDSKWENKAKREGERHDERRGVKMNGPRAGVSTGVHNRKFRLVRGPREF